jgi:predicted Zn-dependent protease with MMP-like domain
MLSMTMFSKTVEEVIDALPEPFRSHLENVVVDVEERPSARVLHEQGLGPDEWAEILGYFDGEPLTEQQYGEHPPNRITLYKQSIEAACRSIDEIRYEIRRTVMHELAHHFGYSEDDLDEFESIDSPFDQDDTKEEP